MSQNDFNIANQGFPATRADLNSALQALASNSGGDTEPSTMYAYQWWYDSTNDVLKMRNADNDAWITIATFSQTDDVTTDLVRASELTGSALIPSGTTIERDTTPAAGYLRFNSTDSSFEGFDGTAWGSIGGGASGGGSDAVFYENDQNVTTDYTIVAAKNAMTAGPITVDSGVTVTIETGARWVVI